MVGGHLQGQVSLRSMTPNPSFHLTCASLRLSHARELNHWASCRTCSLSTEALCFGSVDSKPLEARPLCEHRQHGRMGGYDPVAYFSQAKDVAGRPDITAVWSNATWRCFTAEHREQFMSSPDKYAPRCGGHCAFAVSFSSIPKAPPAPPGIPHRWSIVDGKLYLNANLSAHVMFRLFNRAPQQWRSTPRMRAG